MGRAVLLAACLLCVAAQGRAASFDCAKARRPIEKTICGDPVLSKADERLAKAFAETLSATLDPGVLRNEQRRWLAERNKIADGAALRLSYQNRIDALEAATEKWRKVKQDISAADAAKTCVVPPSAPYDTKCTVDAFDTIGGDGSLRYQLQSYKDGDLRAGGGVVVFKAAGDRLVPIIVAADEQAHYEEPERVASPAGTLLVLPGHLEGTGNFNIESVYLYDNGKPRDLDTESWLSELQKRLPKGWGAWKGIYPDYKAMTAETPLWKEGDANCCPTAGRASIRLALKGERLVIAGLEIEKGEDAARADKPAPSSEDTDTGIDICGKAMNWQIDVNSLTEGPMANDKDALQTAEDRGPNLIHKAFKELCDKKTLAADAVTKRINRVIISWAGGADDFNAYFPEEKDFADTLVTEWVWQGKEEPAVDDVRTGILCAFKPKEKICADRGP